MVRDIIKKMHDKLYFNSLKDGNQSSYKSLDLDVLLETIKRAN